MAFIGEITIKVEYPEDAKKELAQQHLDEWNEFIVSQLDKDDTATYHVEVGTVYDEEDMRKEMEQLPRSLCGSDLSLCNECTASTEQDWDYEECRKQCDLPRQAGDAPCHDCINVDIPQKEEPCSTCLAHPHCYSKFVRCK